MYTQTTHSLFRVSRNEQLRKGYVNLTKIHMLCYKFTPCKTFSFWEGKYIFMAHFHHWGCTCSPLAEFFESHLFCEDDIHLKKWVRPCFTWALTAVRDTYLLSFKNSAGNEMEVCFQLYLLKRNWTNITSITTTFSKKLRFLYH